ncbi:MAG: hypothetical protein LAP87_02265 [Acidobacteriia bacterium]|nr:hypothetical protein [Terriglobia bacterium]
MTVPRTMSFCKVCGMQTPHEWREGGGIVVKICLACTGRDDLYALERD